MALYRVHAIDIPVAGGRGDRSHVRTALGRLHARFPHVAQDADPDYDDVYLAKSGYAWTTLPPDAAPRWWLRYRVVMPDRAGTRMRWEQMRTPLEGERERAQVREWNPPPAPLPDRDAGV